MFLIIFNFKAGKYSQEAHKYNQPRDQHGANWKQQTWFRMPFLWFFTRPSCSGQLVSMGLSIVDCLHHVHVYSILPMRHTTGTRVPHGTMDYRRHGRTCWPWMPISMDTGMPIRQTHTTLSIFDFWTAPSLSYSIMYSTGIYSHH